ncbi:MAG: amidohydrolase [Acidaminococcaceae bacterium]|nr:amidohydrolase [Acidaminococcaceae bacterium]
MMENVADNAIDVMKQTIIFGNIITMDEKRPFARAALVKNGVFAYIGEAEEAKRLAGHGAQVLDYGDNYIYPGFLESHCHGHLAGLRLIGQANLMEAGLTDYAKYREIIREFIAKNPQRNFYVASGWVENEEYVSKAYLDEICADKPLLLHTGGGHSMLLNTKALEWAGIDAAYAKKIGYDMVHVDANGEPDGYICENPVFEIVPKLPTTVEDIKEYLLAWQDYALSSGFTAVGDAGVEVVHRDAPQAYHELEEEGRLKLRTYAYMYVLDNIESPKAEIARIAAERAQLSGEYFHIIGAKAFLDGVTEAHTGWQNQDYLDQPGYHGVERFNDHDKMVELITEADKEGMAVHVHSEGGGAVHFMLDCIEDAEKITGNLDQRNVLAHLHFVTEEDIRRMGATGSIPAVPPLWTAEIPGNYEIEVSYVGKELAENSYPIKSFYDAGANVVFHSDYPVSPLMNVKYSFYTAEKRSYPEEVLGGIDKPHNLKEAITREQSLRAMTINVARQWHQEHRMGSIEFGKIANMTVFDCDFLHDDLEKVAQANIIATVVDGEEVFKA